MILRRALMLFTIVLGSTPLLSCGGANSLFGGDLTTDPLAIEIAEAAGNASAGLEVSLVGAGLLTELPLGELPTDAVTTAESALNTLLGSCLTATAITGPSTGLDLQFVDGGCGLPATNINLEGGLAFDTSETDTTATWSLEFFDFRVAGIQVDGGLSVTIGQNNAMSFAISQLTVIYSGKTVLVDATGSITTTSKHDQITFTGAGSVSFGNKSYAMTITDLNRHLTTDCYPESGTITISKTENGDTTAASVTFEDGTLGTGLDSDDTGKVAILLNGKTHTAQLPGRVCTGF